MPLKTRKKAAGKKLAVGAQTTEQRVDEYGRLQGEVEELLNEAAKAVEHIHVQVTEKRKQMADLEEQIRGAATRGLDGKQPAEVAGKRFRCRIGKAKLNTVISNMERLIELLGENFRKVAKVNIGDIRDYLTPEERKQVITETHDGARSFKVEPIA